MMYKGNPVSSGVAFGEVFLYEPFDAAATEQYLSEDEIPAAVSRYENALERARAELEAIRERLGDDSEQAKIFSAHIDILFDEAMDEDIRMMIEDDLASPDWAVQQVYGSYIELLAGNSNPVIAERAADLRDVRNRILRCWAGREEHNLSDLDKPVIVAARDLTPSDTATLDRSKVLAIVAEVGGPTSHSAIIARSYGIPALLGVSGVTGIVKTGQPAVVDAVAGMLITDPDPQQITAAKAAMEAYAAKAAETKKYLHREPVTPDGQRVEIELNIASAEPSQLADVSFADGVGLFRSEFLYMERDRLPTEEEQFEAYRRVLTAFGERPVILRTLDIGGDKQLPCLDMPNEENPFLGKRALRLCLDRLPVFETQLRAALRAAVFGNLWIMFPMVGSMEDIRAAKAVVERVKAQLEREDVSYGRDVKLGIMVEIPSIALIADMVVKEVDFASIGTNDLTQYTCAVDRMNHSVAEHYQPCHPAVFRLIRYTAQQFALAGKPLSVCGEMGGDPLTAAVLIGCGIRRLSMGASSVARIKKLVCHLPTEQAERLADAVCTLATAGEAEKYLHDAIDNML